MEEIASALAVGKEVITHTDPVSVPGWSGAGYIILDPDTGDGAYKIGGGADGGFVFAFVLTAFAFIVAIYLFQTSIVLGSLLLIWESINFTLWIKAINAADSEEDFDKANFGQAIVTLLGLIPVPVGMGEVRAVIWFGILFSALLVNVL